MNERRPLVDGLKTTDATAAREEAFVYGHNPPADPAGSAPQPPAATQPPARQGRSPVSTRIRSDIADALKRASLDRQLKGESPYTVQDILEAALEPWLRSNGYLK